MVAPDGPKLPSPAPARAVLFGLPPAGRRLPGAARAALAFGAPALIAVIWQSLFNKHAPLDAIEMFRVHLDLIFGERRTT